MFARLLNLFSVLVCLLAMLPAQAEFRVHTGNRALVLTDEKDVGLARWATALNEQKEILGAYFLWDGDKIGIGALAAFREAARRGASARLIVDDMSIVPFLPGALRLATIKALKDEGVDIRIFNPTGLKSPLDLLNPANLNPNNLKRDHDKLLYLGGQHILFTGDRNVQNINFRLNKKKHLRNLSYRSIETMVIGDVADEAQDYINNLWQASTEPDLSAVSESDVRRERRRLDAAFKAMGNLPTDAQVWLDKAQPVDKVRFVHDEVGTKGQSFEQDAELEDLIDSAENEITLVSPYIHLQKRMMDAVIRALARGVKVEIITASLKTTDAPMSSLGFEHQAEDLIKKGVSISLHQGPDFMHSKMILVDRRKAFVGSDNLNGRSLMQDMESGLIFDDEGYGEQIYDYVTTLKAESKPFARSTGFTNRCLSLLLNIGSNLPFLKNQF